MGSTYRSVASGKLVDASSLSVLTSSKPVDLRSLSKAALDLQWTGAGTGTFTLEASVDHDPVHGDANGTWTNIGLVVASPTGVTSNTLISLIDVAYPWLRLKYTPAAGTIVLTAWLSAKT